MRVLRNLRWVAVAGLFVLAACGQTPETTEEARGVLAGVNIVLALSVLFIVIALGIVAAAVAIDRVVRSRGSLEEGPPVDVPEEEEDEVVAGIGVGRASVPRWLYAAYVLIPLFAMVYVVSNVAVAPAAPKESAAPAAPSGPCTDCKITAQSIKFSTDKLTVAAAKPVTVAFDNTDSVPHTFTVYEDEAAATSGGKKLGDTGILNSKAKGTAKFTGPAKGKSLFFNCTVHPSMKGSVEGA
jgi:plastocyanin